MDPGSWSLDPGSYIQDVCAYVQIYTNANLFKKGYRPAVDSALSVSRVGSSGQFIYFKRLVGTIKNDLTNYRQYVDSSQISDVESDDILLLKLKGIAIECIY